MEEYLDLLTGNALFEGIEASDLPALLSSLHAHRQGYPKAALIRQEGDKADFLGLVLGGTAQIYQDDYNGNRTLISGLGPGTLFGEAFACAGVEELPVNILAVTDCVVLFLEMDRLLTPSAETARFHPRIMANLLKIMAEKNTFLNQKLRIVSRKTTAEKLLAFLSEQARLHHGPEFTIPYDRQALADYLGVDRSAMSVELSKLQKAGILETKRSKFRLLK